MHAPLLMTAVNVVCAQFNVVHAEVRHASLRVHRPPARQSARAVAREPALVPLPLRASTATSHRGVWLLRALGMLAQRCRANRSHVIAFCRHRTREHDAESVPFYCSGRL